jgi:hypothetical protein
VSTLPAVFHVLSAWYPGSDNDKAVGRSLFNVPARILLSALAANGYPTDEGIQSWGTLSMALANLDYQKLGYQHDAKALFSFIRHCQKYQLSVNYQRLRLPKEPGVQALKVFSPSH